MDDNKKIKITAYFSPSTIQNMNNYISMNYSSSYGATSDTLEKAVNFYIQSPESITPQAFEKSKVWQEYQQRLEEVKNEECATE